MIKPWKEIGLIRIAVAKHAAVFSKTLYNCVGTCQRLPARQQFTANRSRQMGPIDLTRRDSHHRHLECRAVRDLLIGG